MYFIASSTALAMLALLTCYIVAAANAAKILISAAVDTGTHISSMVPLINRLAEDGHKITVFETSSLKKAREFSAPNVRVVFIPMSYDRNFTVHVAHLIYNRSMLADTLERQYSINAAKLMGMLRDPSNVVTIRELINAQWDLVIIDELFGVFSYAVAMNLKRYRNTPYIVYGTTTMIHTTIHNLALGRNYVSEPNLFSAIPRHNSDVFSAASLRDRLDNIYNIVLDLYYVNYYSASKHMKIAKAMEVPDFSFNKLLTQSSWIFVDYMTRMRFAFTESAEIRSIGANCRTTTRSLNAELTRFVEDSTSLGTIYIAFGSYIRWEFAPAQIVDAFFALFDEFTDYRIIFAYNGPKPFRMPGAHVKLLAWAPQLEILAHAKTKVFFSHGGLKSWKEALCQALPVIYMPVFAEQSYNAKLALRMGYAQVLNKFTVSAHRIIDALQTILKDYDRFKSNAIRARAIYLDRPVPALDEAAQAVQRVLKTSAHTRLPYFQRRAVHHCTLYHTLYVLHILLLLFLIGLISR